MKTFKATIQVSGEIEITIKAKNAKEANAVANHVADNATINNMVYKKTAIDDVSDMLDYAVESVDEEEA